MHFDYWEQTLAMGSTHRAFQLTEQHLSKEEAFAVFQDIRSAFTLGDQSVYYGKFKLQGIAEFPEIQKQYGLTNRAQLISFSSLPLNSLHSLLDKTDTYGSLDFSFRQGELGSHPSLSFSLMVDTEPETLRFYLNLPYLDGLPFCIAEVTRLLRHLIADDLLFIIDREIELVVHSLLTQAASGLSGSWTYEDRVKLTSRGDTQPIGTKDMIPSSVWVEFDAHAVARSGGPVAMGHLLYTSLCSFFQDQGYTLSGFVNSPHPGTIVSHFPAGAGEFVLPINLDLGAQPHFSFEAFQALLAHFDGYIVTEKFDWKDEAKVDGDNRLSLWVDPKGSIELVVELDKRIDEVYILEIEEAIGHEFEYLGLR